ncbi:uncharacterized protein LOC128882946 isoform X2 [Hylaeus volcanicus]|uniref:uncharacterized protein LOC128882946 isoform X2 n=1 Tax=Hylaeus volcanicus TaxID=313075 RepID=UPI0023B81419|nr:uncharacterized protein LOC128882946 isoform X2 [Hylaeus volcanicus]
MKRKKNVVYCYNTSALKEKEKLLLDLISYSGEEAKNEHTQTFLRSVHFRNEFRKVSFDNCDIKKLKHVSLCDTVLIDSSNIPDLSLTQAAKKESKDMNVKGFDACALFSKLIMGYLHDLLNMHADHASTIQLWKVTPSSLNTSSLVLFWIQKGQYCRSLEWARYSNLSSTHIGLLFFIQGDCSVCCYSIPSLPFTELKNPQLFEKKPVWQCSSTLFSCVSPAPFYTLSASVLNKSENSKSGLRIAAGCTNGRLQIIYLNASLLEEPKTMSSFKTEIVVADKIPISSVAWCPCTPVHFVAASTVSGIVKIWDIRQPLNGCIYRLEYSRRPVYNIVWPPTRRFLYACQNTAWFLDTLTQECHQRPTGSTNYSSLRSEQPAWSCAALNYLALFACDKGQLLLQPIHRITKTPEAFQWMIEWKIVRKQDNYYKESFKENSNSTEQLMPNSQAAQDTCLRKECFKKKSSDEENLRINFHKEVSLFYTKSILSCRHADALLQLNVRIGKNINCNKSTDMKKSINDTLPNCLNEIKEFEEKECLCRLHSVCTLDTTIYPKSPNPLIAVGGSLGIVNIFNPTNWGFEKD